MLRQSSINDNGPNALTLIAVFMFLYWCMCIAVAYCKYAKYPPDTGYTPASYTVNVADRVYPLQVPRYRHHAKDDSPV